MPPLDNLHIVAFAEPKLEAGDCSFDAVLICVSVQYLQQPEKVFAEIYRVLKPGGVCIVSFSNRMFYEKVKLVVAFYERTHETISAFVGWCGRRSASNSLDFLFCLRC